MMTTDTQAMPMSANKPFRPANTKTKWGTHIALIIVCFIVCIPAIYALIVATLTTLESTLTPPVLTPGTDFGANVETLFDQRDFGGLILNTTIVAFMVVIGKTVFAILAGLAFVYFRFPGKTVLFFFILLTLLLPTEIILVPLLGIMGELEWIRDNPRLALSIPFLGTAVGVFLFRQHFTNIPRELAEAAQIDGASPLRFMFSVLIPMSWNVIGAHAMIQFISTWNQYLWPVLAIQDQKDQLIQIGVSRAASLSGQTDFGLLMTAGIIASIPPLLLFVILQKQFMNGFAITRDK